jgi:hypothetical protein
VDAAEARSAALLKQHRFSTQLIDEIQSENAGLSGLFYALVGGPRPVDRAGLLARLDKIEDQVRQTLEAARTEATKAQWDDAKVAVERCIAGVREVLTSASMEAPASLYRMHDDVVSAIAQLVAANYQATIEEDARTHANRQSIASS